MIKHMCDRCGEEAEDEQEREDWCSPGHKPNEKYSVPVSGKFGQDFVAGLVCTLEFKTMYQEATLKNFGSLALCFECKAELLKDIVRGLCDKLLEKVGLRLASTCSASTPRQETTDPPDPPPDL